MKSRVWLLVCVGLAGPALAADWPQWRGPQRNGVSQETGLLKQWPKDGPRLLWQVKDIDYGYSTPAVVGDRLYLLSNKGSDNEFAQALSVKDGKQVWAQPLGKVGPNQGLNYPGARSTPTVDGDVLYALGSDGDLACLATADGKVRWQKNLRKEFGGTPGQWAYSESPLIDGDLVVCAPGGSEASVVALNKNTGDHVWKTAVPGGDKAAYASAVVVEVGGRKQYVEFLAGGLVGVDAKTGKLLWRFDKTVGRMGMNIQTPVAVGDKIYSVGVGSQTSSVIQLKADGEKVMAEPVYSERGLPSAIGGSVEIGGYLYGTSRDGLVCAEFATGKVKWKDKCIGAAALCCADGLLFLHGEDGQVALVEATPDGYHEKGRFTPPDQPKHLRGGMEKAWAYPVVANGRLYIRDVGTLWCYDVKGNLQ